MDHEKGKMAAKCMQLTGFLGLYSLYGPKVAPNFFKTEFRGSETVMATGKAAHCCFGYALWVQWAEPTINCS